MLKTQKEILDEREDMMRDDFPYDHDKFSDPVEDAVKSPKHYMFYDTESIEIIKAALTPEEFLGFCKGNTLKYRLRAGKKELMEQDIAKADQYEKIYANYKLELRSKV